MARRPRSSAASLRGKLDALAEKTADEAMDAPLNQKVNALKVCGAYWAMSRKSDKDGGQVGDSAWDRYAEAMYSNGKDADAEAH